MFRHQFTRVLFILIFLRQVDALLKRQEAQFNQRLQMASLCSDQKETDLHEQMKEEQKELAELRSAVVEVTQSRESLLKMLEQYKGMLSSVVKGKTTVDKASEDKCKDLEKQKMQALEDLSNVEAAFSDVHRQVNFSYNSNICVQLFSVVNIYCKNNFAYIVYIYCTYCFMIKLP